HSASFFMPISSSTACTYEITAKASGPSRSIEPRTAKILWPSQTKSTSRPFVIPSCLMFLSRRCLFLGDLFLCRFRPRIGFVGSRQRFARRCQTFALGRQEAESLRHQEPHRHAASHPAAEGRQNHRPILQMRGPIQRRSAYPCIEKIEHFGFVLPVL